MPHVKSSLRTVGNEAVQSLSNIAKDTIKGRNIKEAAQEHAAEAVSNIKTYSEKKLRGEGVKKKTTNKKIILKKRKLDIFDT